MNTLIHCIADMVQSAGGFARSEYLKILQRAAMRVKSRRPHTYLESSSSLMTASGWCRDSSSDILGGLNVHEVSASTIPGELQDELFNR